MEVASNTILSERKAEAEEGSTSAGTHTTKAQESWASIRRKDITTILRTSSLSKYLIILLQEPVILVRENASSETAEGLTETELNSQMK